MQIPLMKATLGRGTDIMITEAKRLDSIASDKQSAPGCICVESFNEKDCPDEGDATRVVESIAVDEMYIQDQVTSPDTVGGTRTHRDSRTIMQSVS